MLLRTHVLDGIRNGTITLAFRRWRRPTVRSGGTLLTHIGQLRIASVTKVDEHAISEHDARQAGFATLNELRRQLGERDEGEVYRVEFGGLGPDPRLALRESLPDDTELDDVLRRLDRLDARAENGAWTRQVLGLIAENPAVLAEKLATRMGMEKHPFKARVRKLKALGLTISLDVGYRLSPRGESVLAASNKP
jgi:hypothetical protein